MKNISIAMLSISILFGSCKNSEEKKDTEVNPTVEAVDIPSAEEENIAVKDAICLLDKLSVRETPTAKGKWITSMSLGEQVSVAGDELLDSISKKNYYKVILTDGKEGWTRATFLAVGGKVATLLEDVSMYKRPDLLTKTDKKYSAMDIIAIIGTQEDWIQVKGKRSEGEYIEEGWIKSSNISENTIDIATAKFAKAAMEKETMTERVDALQEVLDNPDLSSTAFSTLINAKIQDYKTKNQIIESVKEDIIEEE